ncbi:MAG: carbohydrate kinase family protein [Nanoarchaeota archaeon]|mgnify:FL=1
MFDIVTVGSNVIDLFLETNVHETKNKMCYEVGAKLLITNLKQDWGGGGTNTAVAFSRLGLKTAYIGKTGNDSNGNKILELLKKEKAKFLGTRGGQTGLSVILDSKEHDRTILTYKGVNDDLRFSEIKPPNTKWLYYSSMLGDSFKTQIKLAKLLRKKYTKLAINPSSYQTEKGSRYLQPLLDLASIIILNKEEAEMLTNKKDLLKGLYNLGPKIVCITDKDKPVLAFDGRRKYKLTPNKKVKAIERTGAGDAFASGFVAGLIKTNDINFALKLGSKNSESVITQFGAKNNLLYWKDVK